MDERSAVGALADPRATRDEEITELARAIADRFQPRQVVLFGSHADGTATGDSDVDLMVVMETERRPLEEALRIRRVVALHPPFPLDIVVHTPEQISVGLTEGDVFIVDVMTRRRVLFEESDSGLA